MSASSSPLEARYTARSGTALFTGVHALVRLMLLQAERDRAAGLRTGGFVSGYRGSPLGTLDSAFAAVPGLLEERGIVVQPAINEEMAATAIGGTQHIAMTQGAEVDGVFALWYGKGPGVDRASDALRHANYAGASGHGGVVVAVGDDHAGKSSSLVVNSNGICAALNLPLLFPADPGEVVSMGLHAFQASRISGSWIGLKIVPDVADSARTSAADELAATPVLPEVDQPADGLHIRWPDTLLEQEYRQHRFRLGAVQRYVRANRLDTRWMGEAGARIGIVASGKSWRDLLEALALLGIDDTAAARLGLSCYKLALIWPVEPEAMGEFASGLESLIVVEEKGPFVETQIRSLLYGVPDAPQRIDRVSVGGQPLLPDDGVLTPEAIARQIGHRILELTGDNMIAARLAGLPAVKEFAEAPVRKAHFCSGCPHNSSTALPAGSRASAGIGCHSMAVWVADNTAVWAQMGGEGIQWTGLSHFTREKHVFANMGDGTYFHSGSLALRQAVAAGATMTYKILFNAAVAMTGGQAVDGDLTVPLLIAQLRAEGVRTIRVVTDDLGKYRDGTVSVDVPVDHRDDLERVQIELRETPGVSVMVYDQMCATELRRSRKRGKLPDPPRRVFINEAVCEGCGDCSVQSNCLSVEPLETPLGTKRQINQSSCNKDMSCLRGFCPSFVTVEGGALKRGAGIDLAPLLARPLPEPAMVERRHSRILVAGIGGTGVVTIGALLATAAHLSGRAAAVLDDVGMAQKGGAVQSSIHIADRADEILAVRITAGSADLLIAADQIVANGRDVIGAVAHGRTRIIANGNVAITGEFTRSGAQVDRNFVHRQLVRAAGESNVERFAFVSLAEELLGDAIGANLMMVGTAFQHGLIPIQGDAIERAIMLNGTAVEMNRRAFRIGRLLAVDPDAVLGRQHRPASEPETLEAVIAHRRELLTAYQSVDYAVRFERAVEVLSTAERAVCADDAITLAAAKSLAKLMAYKDEYEVARLYAETDFIGRVTGAVDGPARVRFHLAPPVFARRDPVTDHLRKRSFGGWMLPVFRILSKMRFLRGTWADPFGRTAERRLERALIDEFEALIAEIAANLEPHRAQAALELAQAPLAVRGFGHVKEAAVARYRAQLPAILARFRRSGTDAANVKRAPDRIAL